MANTVVLTDVPGENLDEVVADYKSAGATVSVAPQPNGLFTVTAVFHESVLPGEILRRPEGILRHALLSWQPPSHAGDEGVEPEVVDQEQQQ
jgi:hypothetical protein